MKITIQNEEYISVEEVERLVKQKSSTIDVKVRYGEFPKPIKLPVVKFWKLSDIEEYLKNSPVPCEVVINGKLWNILLDPGTEKERVESLKKMLESGDLMFKREVMSELGIGPGLVERYVGEGMLPSPMKVGNLKVWKRSDIEAFRENVPSREGDVVYLRKRKDLLDLYKTEEIIEMLCITKHTLCTWLKTKKDFPQPFRVGHRLLWHKELIDEYLEKKANKSTKS
jgi:predicted DNA-binding transcriptional regulator AlpA